MLDTEKAGPAEQVQIIEKSVEAILEGAETLLSAGPSTTEKIVSYVREIQRADAALARAVTLAREAGLEADEARLGRKRRNIDNSVAEQITNIANNIGKERDKSIATINALFKLGHAPDVAIDGPCRGQLLSSTLFGPLDTFGRSLARLYLPWKGKKFDAASASGCNIFTRSAPVIGRLIWPSYSAWKRYRPGKFTAFKFNTYTGQGVQDPEVSTLKLDYDNPTNPRLLIRSVLDELVQISGNYYLGKAMLWRPNGRYRLAAFFALRKQEEAKETGTATFDPDRLAYLEVAGLRAYYDHKWLRAFRLIVDLMHEQFGLSWLRSLQASYYTVRAMLAWAPLDNDPKTMHRYIRKFYKLAATYGNELHFDAKEAGDREFVYWDLHRKRGMVPSSDPEPYIECLAQLHSTLFSLTPQEARKSAVLRAHATDAIDRVTGKRSTDVEADWRKSEEYLRQAYRSAIGG
jgi:hypothetical protein